VRIASTLSRDTTGDYQRVQFHRAQGPTDLVLVKGNFFLLVTLDTPEEPPMVPERFLGIDLGIINLATDSDTPVSWRVLLHRQALGYRVHLDRG
jgi:transposase